MRAKGRMRLSIIEQKLVLNAENELGRHRTRERSRRGYRKENFINNEMSGTVRMDTRVKPLNL